MEARVGIEPTIEDLQSSALPLGDRAILKGIRGKRSRLPIKSSEFYHQLGFLYLICLIPVFLDLLIMTFQLTSLRTFHAAT